MTISYITDRLIVCETETEDMALEYIAAKRFTGWRVLVEPFPSDHALLEIEDDVTRPVISEYTFILHRFFA